MHIARIVATSNQPPKSTRKKIRIAFQQPLR